jgi:diguanylate cyclase (GGDEF)-like protein
MSDSAPKPSVLRAGDLAQLTAKIRQLSIPAKTADETLNELDGSALLLVRDSTSRKWGPRWLGQSGLQTTIPADFSNVGEIIAAECPDVVLVEASILNDSGEPVFAELQRNPDIDTPMIVLCANSREITAALDAGAVEIASKPLEWQAIANRAKIAWRLRKHQELLDAKELSLQEALELADIARQKLRSQQIFEPVTGLPNKSKFMDLLRRGMRAADRDKSSLAVFVVGFTRFRLVVEAMGQDQADSILTEIGQNLAECLQNYGTAGSDIQGIRTAAVASLDQFRFGLMMTCSNDNDEHVAFQQHLFETLSRPVQVAGQIVHLSACLGIALYPQDADSVDSLLQRADNAMHDAQSRGGGYKFYCTETDAAAARKLKLEHMLHEALDRAELSLAYQPILDVASDETIAAEALLRWRQADGSYIPPEEFVAVAEECGLMIRTGEFVLDQACEQFAAWRDAEVALSYMCVNVSKAQLLSSGFALSVRRILEKHNVQPCDLELEISERGVLSGDIDVIKQLHELKSLGVKLSIDDFGTGDSAIAYLKDLPVDTLKIDRSYIAGLADDSKDAALASAMVALGQRLDLVVIAEGVETENQLQILRELGCDAYQGFLRSEPVPAETFAARLTK